MVLLEYDDEQLISWIDSMGKKSAKLVFNEWRFNHSIRLSLTQSYYRDDLAKPASNLYLHNLTGILETAIRATNAQFDDSDILKRLDVRLLEVGSWSVAFNMMPVSCSSRIGDVKCFSLCCSSLDHVLYIYHILFRLKS